MERIKLSHDHMEYGTGFHVKEVEIDVPSNGSHYTFPCNCWLAQDVSSEMTVKDLNSSTPKPSKIIFRIIFLVCRNRGKEKSVFDLVGKLCEVYSLFSFLSFPNHNFVLFKL